MKASNSYLKTILLSSAVSFTFGLVGIYVSKVIGPTSRGHLAQLVLITLLSTILSDLGTQSSVTYHVARGNDTYSRIYRWAMRRIIFRTTFLGAPIIIFAKFLGWLDLNEMLILLAFIFLSSLLASNMHALQAIDLVKWRTFLLAQIPIFILLNVYFYNTGYTVLGVYISVYLPTLFPPLLAFFFLKKEVFAQSNSDLCSTEKDFNNFAHRSLNWEISMQIFNRIDLILVLIFFGQSEMGNYSVVISWMLVANPLFGALGNIGFPKLASLHDEVDVKSKFSRKLLLTSFSAAIAIVTLFSLVGFQLLPNILGDAYQDVKELFPAVVLLSAAKLLLPVIGDIARGNNSMSLLSLHLYCGVFVSLIITLIFDSYGFIPLVYCYSFTQFIIVCLAGLQISKKGK